MRRRLLLLAVMFVPTLVFAANYGLFQRPLEQVLERDDRNRGLAARAHWRWYVDPTVLVFDLQETGAETKGVDVLRALLQFAYRQKGRTFRRVLLAWRGVPRFEIAGSDFADLGRQYPYRSPVDTMVAVPPMVRRLDGSRAFPEPAPGPWLEQQERRALDFNRFVNEWVGGGR